MSFTVILKGVKGVPVKNEECQKEQHGELLEEIKRVLPGNEDNIYLALVQGAWDALGVHEQTKTFVRNPLTKKELTDTLGSVLSALRKIRNGVGRLENNLNNLKNNIEKLGEANASPLDTIFYDANDKDDALMSEVLETHSSGFEKIIEQFHKSPDLLQHPYYKQLIIKMEKTIERYLSDHIGNPGRGRGKRSTQSYSSAIEILARYFQENLPDERLSSARTVDERGSIFYKYVAFWHREILKEEKTDLRRHIKAVIKSDNSSLHWR